MRKLNLFNLLLIITSSLYAQVIDDVAGKTYYYYDSLTHRKVKEIYHHKQMVKVMPDPKNYGSYIDTFMYIKDGPYTRYYENGKLECSGFYKNERKDSIWLYYNMQGIQVRTEKYRNGKLVN
jgi:hypothetical protein